MSSTTSETKSFRSISVFLLRSVAKVRIIEVEDGCRYAYCNRRKYGHAPAAPPRCPSKPSAASQACCVAISWVHGRISAAARASRA